MAKRPVQGNKDLMGRLCFRQRAGVCKRRPNVGNSTEEGPHE
jgi:hypothetical protein